MGLRSTGSTSRARGWRNGFKRLSNCLSIVDERTLQALLNPRRREMLRLLWDEERASGEIARHFDVSWPAVSQNLRVLEEAGLVRVRREGRRRLYRADPARVLGLVAALRQLWERDLDRLAALAEAEGDREDRREAGEDGAGRGDRQGAEP